MTKEQLEIDICILFGGLYAENILLENYDISSRIEELKNINTKILSMIKEYGFSNIIGFRSITNNTIISTNMSNLIDKERLYLINFYQEKVKNIIDKNQELLKIIKQELLQNEVLNFYELNIIIYNHIQNS